ncbi:HD domain-containing protein [Candidatus Tisiphia endosymbiont of Parasteatoda lunata]|uniref:HD domain-containing protein n=1 Tax=Candidatus Tisiphia endosymbiont of Parasteatoda lunata TaxID=3066275 RepID=UPI00313F16C0
MGLLLRHYWPLAIKQYFQYYYYFSLWYCLPFITTFTFLLEDKNPEWLINITCSIVLLIILVDWVMFIILSTTAILFAVTIYYLLVNNFIINVYSIYLLVYTCILSIIISIIFVRKKQQYLHTLINNQQALKKLYASTNDELIDALNYQEKIARSLGKEGLEILQQAQNITNNLCKEIMTNSSEIFTTTYSKLTSIMKYLEEIANQAKNYIRLEVKIINLDHLLKEINDKVIKLDSAIVLTFLNKIPYKTLVCDVNLIGKLLINTIIQIKKYRVNTSNIQIYIDSTELWYRLDSIKNYTKKIPAIRFIITTLEDIGELPNFYMGDVTNAAFTLNNKQDLYQTKNIKIINAHYGALHSNEFNNEYSIIIVLPLNIRDVRPKTMDLKENDTVLQEVISDSLDIETIENQLIQDINKKNQSIDITSFKKAIKLIKKYHAKQKRKSGEPFYLHPIAVTKILLQFTFDEDILLAALLHDVVEDTPMSLSKIEAIFNPTVAALVSGVTKFDQTKEKLKLSKYENILKLLEQEDTRVLMIKIADRIHNMRTLSYHESYEKQKIIAEETLQFYIPMANKLGLSKAVTELKHLVFQILNNLSTPSS